MNIEFLIHGSLTGQSYWKDIDRDYCSHAYAPTPENTIFEVEVASNARGEFCTYYNYLRYNNVVSTRVGAYFGMTVRIDGEIWLDAAAMYRILDILFHHLIVGSILVVRNDKYVYTCENFQSVDRKLRDAEERLGDMLGGAVFEDSDVIKIKKGYSRKDGVRKINVNDLNTKFVREVLEGGHKLIASPEFPTSQMLTMQKKLTSVQQQANNQIKQAQDECDKKIEELKRDLQQEKTSSSTKQSQNKKKIQQLTNELDCKQAEINNLRAQFNNARLDTEINQTAKELRNPIDQLAKIMSERFPSGHELQKPKTGKHGNSVNLKQVSVVVLAVLALALFCGAYFSFRAIEKNTANTEKLVQSLSLSVDSLKYVRAETVSISHSQEQDSAFTHEHFSNIRIDIKEIRSSDPLIQGKTYTLSIQGDNAPKGGQWLVNKKPLMQNRYQVDAMPNTEALIEYCIDNEPIASRSIMVRGS